MIQTDDGSLNWFHALYPEIPEPQVPAAYDCFRRYAHLAAEIIQPLAQPDLTDAPGRGSVFAGRVDPKRTFTNTG